MLLPSLTVIDPVGCVRERRVVRQTADMMKQHVVRTVRPGSIVLFHANGRGWHTGSALPRIIEALRKEKYEFLTVSELLATRQMGNCLRMF